MRRVQRPKLAIVAACVGVLGALPLAAQTPCVEHRSRAQDTVGGEKNTRAKNLRDGKLVASFILTREQLMSLESGR